MSFLNPSTYLHQNLRKAPIEVAASHAIKAPGERSANDLLHADGIRPGHDGNTTSQSPQALQRHEAFEQMLDQKQSRHLASMQRGLNVKRTVGVLRPECIFTQRQAHPRRSSRQRYILYFHGSVFTCDRLELREKAPKNRAANCRDHAPRALNLQRSKPHVGQASRAFAIDAQPSRRQSG